MSLSRKSVAALEARSQTGAMPCAVDAEDGPHRLTLHLTAAGPVGLAFEALDFATTARAEWTPEALDAWGNALAARITYLMEPLVVLERDPVAGAVALRSETPTARGDQRAYYEVRLDRAGTLRLSRTAFDEESRRRRPALCQITLESLERLIDDLVACIP